MSHARPAEHQLHDRGVPHQRPDLQGGQGDDRDHRVAQGVAPQHRALREPGRAQRAHVVLGELIEHGRAHQPEGDADAFGRQRDGRQDDAVEAAVPGQREPAELDCEDASEDQREHEVRHAHAEVGDAQHDVVEPRVATRRDVHAERNGDPVGQDRSREHQLEAVRAVRAEHVGDRLARLDRRAEVEREQIADEVPVLNRDRLVRWNWLISACLASGDASGLKSVSSGVPGDTPTRGRSPSTPRAIRPPCRSLVGYIRPHRSLRLVDVTVVDVDVLVERVQVRLGRQPAVDASCGAPRGSRRDDRDERELIREDCLRLLEAAARAASSFADCHALYAASSAGS